MFYNRLLISIDRVDRINFENVTQRSHNDCLCSQYDDETLSVQTYILSDLILTQQIVAAV